MKKWDFVRVVDYNESEIVEEEIQDFIGAEGIVIEVLGAKYPYNLVFFDSKLQRKSMDIGGIWWRGEDLEWI